MRRILLAVSAVALLVGGCGTPDVAPDRGQLAVAAAATTDARTARMDATFSMETPSPMGTMTMTMEGVVDLVAMAAQMTMVQEMGSYGTLRGEIVMVDGFIYMRTDPDNAPPNVPAGVWLRQEVPEEAASWQDPMSGGHPGQMIEMLRDLGVEVETIGSEQVRGVDTTRYRARPTGEEMTRMAAATGQPDLDVPIDQLSFLIDVWIDDDDLLRRTRTETDMSALAPEVGLDDEDATWTSVMDMELYDFGVDVTITAPPEDEVIDHDPATFTPSDGAAGVDIGGHSETVTPGVQTEEAAAFPDEFPQHRDAWVLDIEQTPTGGWRMVTYVAVFDQAHVDRVVAEHVDNLSAHGWEITDRRTEGASEHLGVAGHGWEGTVVLTAEPDRDELLVTVTLEPAA